MECDFLPRHVSDDSARSGHLVRDQESPIRRHRHQLRRHVTRPLPDRECLAHETVAIYRQPIATVRGSRSDKGEPPCTDTDTLDENPVGTAAGEVAGEARAAARGAGRGDPAAAAAPALHRGSPTSSATSAAPASARSSAVAADPARVAGTSAPPSSTSWPATR